MAVSDWKTTASQNTTIEGISVGENVMPPSAVNDLFRAMAAAIKNYSLGVSSPSGSYMPLTGGAFTGTITRSGAGGYLYHASSSQAQGPVYTLASGTSLPSAVEGAVVFFYS